MTASIHLVRLEVSGWKGIKEPAVIEFGDTSWLIHGANEAGKSSLFSALRFALFEYSDTGAAYSSGWVNSDSITAEVKVELKIGGVPYTIEKIRDHKKNGKTNLYDGIGPSRRERAEKNKDADHAIMQLIGASARKGHGSEVPSSWGLLAWLLAPQAIDTVSVAREHATEALGLGNAISAEFQTVKGQVLAFCKSSFGKSQSPRKGSDLWEAQDRVATLERTKTAIVEQRQQFDDALLKLAALEERRPDLELHLKEAQEAQEAARDATVDFAASEQELQTLSARLEGKKAEVTRADESVAVLQVLDQEIADFEGEVAEANQKIGELRGDEGDARSELVGAREQAATISERLERNGRTVETNRTWVRAAQHFDRIAELDRKLDRIEAFDANLKELEDVGPVLTDAEIDQRLQCAADLEQAESLLSSLAEERRIRVSVEGRLEADWLRDGVPTEYTEGLGFASEVQVQAQDFTLTIGFDERDGAIDWVQRRLELRRQLSGFGHETSDSLREEMTTERKRSREHGQLLRDRDSLGDAADLSAERERLEAMEVEPPPEGTPPVEALEAEVEDLLEEIERDKTATKTLRENESKLQKKVEELDRALGNARANHRSKSDQLGGAKERRDKEIEKDGLLAAREQRSHEANEERGDLETELREATEQLRANKGAHSEELTRLRRVVRQAEKDLRDSETDIKSFERRAQELGGQELQGRLISVGEELMEARRELERIERRSTAYLRLGAKLDRFMVEATDVETAPVRDRVQRWLQLVTQGHWMHVEMDSKLEVTMLDGRPPKIDGESMGSVGLRQVIHALTRLAVAVKIHEDGKANDPSYPPVAIVMDESQSHVDSERVRRLMHVFNEQIKAGSVQVIALSHRRDEFQNLVAMNYDIERREAYDLDGI